MKKYLSNDLNLDEMIDVLDETPIWSAPFGLKLLEHIDYKTGISAIDIGSGTGFPLTEIALRLGDSTVVYGIDPWKEVIRRINKKVELYGIGNIRMMEGVAESIPLGNGSVDLVTSNNGINNVGDLEKAISECSRILKQGGQFIQTMNTNLSMFEFYEQLRKVLSELHLEKVIDTMHRHISQKRPPVAKMLSLLQKNGFAIKDLEHDQFQYRFANGTAMLNHYFIRLAFMGSWIKLLPADRVEQVFETIEMRLNEQSRMFGNIQLSIPFVVINAVKK